VFKPIKEFHTARLTVRAIPRSKFGGIYTILKDC